MLETYAIYVIAAAALLGITGYVWLVVRAFRQSQPWGWALIVFPPAALLFIGRHFRQAVAPVRLLVLAVVLAATPYVLNYYERHFVPLKPYEQMVDGELRITLTGLKSFDYSVLRQRPQVVVLQMANPDVDDRTLENLKGLADLTNLDLNGTQISDEGLAQIAALPKLKVLRIARTKVTDEGFRAQLFSKDSLLNLDLTGTEIKGKTKRDWKNEKPNQREYVD